jgi:hypothetical protein
VRLECGQQVPWDGDVAHPAVGLGCGDLEASPVDFSVRFGLLFIEVCEALPFARQALEIVHAAGPEHEPRVARQCALTQRVRRLAYWACGGAWKILRVSDSVRAGLEPAIKGLPAGGSKQLRFVPVFRCATG